VGCINDDGGRYTLRVAHVGTGASPAGAVAWAPAGWTLAVVAGTRHAPDARRLPPLLEAYAFLYAVSLWLAELGVVSYLVSYRPTRRRAGPPRTL
jgi:hypothetical protein